MNSLPDFEDCARAGRDDAPAASAARRTSSAFGSPGTDSTVRRVDLNDALIRHPDATFVMRAAGTAMVDAGIADGGVLLVDRAVTASHGAVVIAVVQGELLCRRLERAPGRAGVTTPIALGPEAPLEVWGVVTTVIKKLAF